MDINPDEKVMTLADLRPGESGVIRQVGGEDALRLRLMEMGLLEGESVRLVRFAPLGDPLEIQLCGYHLSLRRESARHIQVTPAGGGPGAASSHDS